MVKELDALTEREFNLDETLELLKANRLLYICWGVSMVAKHKDAGLLLRVHAHHLDGWVFVTLAWDDTYTVHYLDENYKVLETTKDIYFDELARVIDKRIEYISDYKY